MIPETSRGIRKGLLDEPIQSMNHALKPLTNDQKAYWQGDSDLIFIRGPNSAGKGINKLARGIYNYICYKTVSRGGFAAPILLFTGEGKTFDFHF